MPGTTLIRSNQDRKSSNLSEAAPVKNIAAEMPQRCHQFNRISVTVTGRAAAIRRHSHQREPFPWYAPSPSWNRVGSEPETGERHSFLYKSEFSGQYPDKSSVRLIPKKIVHSQEEDAPDRSVSLLVKRSSRHDYLCWNLRRI